MKAKIEIKQVYEIDLPHYRSGSCHWYKVISETEAIQIHDSGVTNAGGISRVPSDFAFTYGESECDESTYNRHIENVISYLLKA